MLAVNVLAGQISDGRTHEYVGREVLLRGYARGADRRCRAVRQKFHKWARVLMRDGPGDRPGRGGMFGRKRSSSVPELASAVALEGPLPARGVPQRLDRNQAIDGGFPAQKATFPLMLIVRQKSQQIKPSGSSRHRIHAVVGNMAITIEGVRRVRQMSADVRVRSK